MDILFEALCCSLDDEIERQENVLEVCNASRKAAQAHDVEYLEAKTCALVSLVQQAVQAESARKKLIDEIASNLGSVGKDRNLTALIAVAPHPWRERLSYYQTRLQGIVGGTRPVVISNMAALRAALRIVRHCLCQLEHGQEAAALSYNAGGMEPSRKDRQPSLIDHRG